MAQYPLTDDKGSKTLYEEIHVPHFLQMSARGIFGRGRDARRDSIGTAGSLRMVGSSGLEERVSFESVGIAQVEGPTVEHLDFKLPNSVLHFEYKQQCKIYQFWEVKLRPRCPIIRPAGPRRRSFRDKNLGFESR